MICAHRPLFDSKVCIVSRHFHGPDVYVAKLAEEQEIDEHFRAAVNIKSNSQAERVVGRA